MTFCGDGDAVESESDTSNDTVIIGGAKKKKKQQAGATSCDLLEAKGRIPWECVCLLTLTLKVSMVPSSS